MNGAASEAKTTSSSDNALRSWLALLSAANALKKSVDARLRSEFGLSISRFDVLAILDRAGPQGLRAGALSQQLMVTEGNTTQVTAPLIRDGLVARRQDKEDARAANFRLTKKGERLFAQMAKAHRGWIEEAFDDFSPQQLESFRRQLGKINPHGPGAKEQGGKERNAA